MRLRIAVLLTLCVAASCQEKTLLDWNRVRGPDGRADWWMLECNTMDRCLERAGSMCSNGYIEAPQHDTHHMLIHCKSYRE